MRPDVRAEAAADFKRFEVENSLFDIRSDGQPLWDRIRFRAWNEFNDQRVDGHDNPEPDRSVLGAAKSSYLLGRSLVWRNPYLSDDASIVVLGAGRRQRKSDGYWWDIYLDPIYQECDLDYVHLEPPTFRSHVSPLRTERYRYFDLIEYGSEVQRRLGLRSPDLSDDAKEQLTEAAKTLETEFGVSIDLRQLAINELHRRNTKMWMYQLLLDRIEPEIVLLVRSYGRETLIEACKARNVPVVELQHGAINPYHFGYSYEGERRKELFPDYFLSWGEFWKESNDFPIPDDRVLNVGYPYLQQRYEHYQGVHSNDQLLFISQASIGQALSKLAVEVARRDDLEYDIVYKTHPSEADSWQKRYPWLKQEEITIVDGSTPSLYRLFAESSAQVGVYSTALFEGLVFDLETYVYDWPGAESLRPLIENGSAELVTDAQDLVHSLGKRSATYNATDYFAPEATERACNAVKEICDTGTVYRA